MLRFLWCALMVVLFILVATGRIGGLALIGYAAVVTAVVIAERVVADRVRQ